MDFSKALDAYLDAVRLAPDNSSYLNMAGLSYHILAHYNKAIEYYEKALKSDLKTLGEGHPKVAIRWNNLGEAWREKGEYDKAIEYYEKALSVLRVKLGNDHPRTKLVKTNLSLAKKEKLESK